MWFLFVEVSSSSWCLGWAALFYCFLPGPSAVILQCISFSGVQYQLERVTDEHLLFETVQSGQSSFL